LPDDALETTVHGIPGSTPLAADLAIRRIADERPD